MVTVNESRVRCWRCDREIDAEDRYCRQCGQGQGACLPWYYRPVWIVLLALTVLGPFALLLVWRTPLLGRGGRWVASVVLVVLTLYFGWRLGLIVGDLGALLAGT